MVKEGGSIGEMKGKESGHVLGRKTRDLTGLLVGGMVPQSSLSWAR